MNKIFIGMILVFLNFEVNIGAPTVHLPDGASIFVVTHSASVLGLIPDFLGYGVMASGLKEIRELSARFSKIIPLVKIMVVVSAIVWVMDLLGARQEVASFYNLALIDFLVIALSVILTAISLFISYNIVFGIKDIEISKTVSLNSDKLYLAWKLKVVCTVIMMVFIFVPPIAIVTLIVGFGAKIYYLYIFYKSKQIFNELVNPPNDEKERNQIDESASNQTYEQK
jgi:hypothetical protein